MSEFLINVENLTVTFGASRSTGGTQVVKGVSLTLKEGQTLAIVGESGSGKSVTARALMGLAGAGSDIQADKFEIANRDARQFSVRDWRRLRGSYVSMVLQDALVSLDPLRTVGAEVGEAIATHHRLSKQEQRNRILELLAQVGIPDPAERYRQYPHELSGGLRQRALIASAIAANPTVLIADEPTTALDTTVQAQVLALLADMKLAGMSLILISHDLAVVAAIADEIIVMKSGEVVEAGSARAVLDSPNHPYTRQLLEADPATRPKGERLTAAARASHQTDPRNAPRSFTGVLAPVVLEGRNLTKRYASGQSSVRLAVDDVSFQLHRGETLGIVGESGSGKSTTARIALGLVQPDAGDVLLDGVQWSDVEERFRRIKRHRLQLIAQDPFGSFDPRFTVRNVIAEALRQAGWRGRSVIDDEVVKLLGQVGLPAAMMGRRPLELSGGQRQRVAIARALAPGSEILICDEPVAALDVSIQAQVLDIMSELQETLGLSMLFISHDLGVIRHMSDRMIVMKDGRVVEAGDTEDIFTNPQAEYTKRLLDSLPTVART